MILIGTYIRQLRRQHNLSLSELSVLADNLSKGYISEVENGHSDPSLATLQSIAKAFGVGAGDLLVSAGYTCDQSKLPDLSVRSATVRVTVQADGRAKAVVVED